MFQFLDIPILTVPVYVIIDHSVILECLLNFFNLVRI